MTALPSWRLVVLGGWSLLMFGGAAYADKFKHPTAVFAGLDKITGRIISFEASVDETVQFGSLQLTARVCYTRDAQDNPRTSTFVEVEEVGSDNQYKKVFSGWMLAQSPGLNAIEHPVYDIWLTDCKGARDPEDRIKTQPELEEADEPPITADTKKIPAARSTQTALPPGQRSTGAPLRLPDGSVAPPGAIPPGGIAVQPPRQAPQQRFFPTNNPPARGYDPAGQGR